MQTMKTDSPDKRREKRVRFFWPVWVGHEKEANDIMYRAKAVDLSKSAIAVTIPDDTPIEMGHKMLTRFSYPKGDDNMFDMGNYRGWAEVIRVDKGKHGSKKIALKLHQPIEEKYYTMPA